MLLILLTLRTRWLYLSYTFLLLFFFLVEIFLIVLFFISISKCMLFLLLNSLNIFFTLFTVILKDKVLLLLLLLIHHWSFLLNHFYLLIATTLACFRSVSIVLIWLLLSLLFLKVPHGSIDRIRLIVANVTQISFHHMRVVQWLPLKLKVGRCSYHLPLIALLLLLFHVPTCIHTILLLIEVL